MELNINTAISIFNLLNKLSDISNISFQLKYKLVLLKNEILVHYNFYNEEMNKIIMLYSEKNEDGEIKSSENGIKIKPENIVECNERINELNSLQVNIDTFITIKEIEELNQFITLEELSVLYVIIKKEEEL